MKATKVVHAYIPALWKAGAVKLQAQVQPGHLRDFERPYLKVKIKKG